MKQFNSFFNWRVLVDCIDQPINSFSTVWVKTVKPNASKSVLFSQRTTGCRIYLGGKQAVFEAESRGNKKETTGVLTTRHRTTAFDDRNIVRNVKKKPTTISDITNNLHRAGMKVLKSTVWRRLWEQKCRGHTTDTDEPQKFYVLCTDETKINLYHRDGKMLTCGKKKGPAHDPKHTSSLVKHGGGSVMAWACMAASGPGSLFFIVDVTHDGSSRMYSQVYINILFASLQRNGSKLVRRNVIVQPRHAANTATERNCSQRKNATA